MNQLNADDGNGLDRKINIEIKIFLTYFFVYLLIKIINTWQK